MLAVAAGSTWKVACRPRSARPRSAQSRRGCRPTPCSASTSSVTVTCADRLGMPLVIVHACRSWTSTTPGHRPQVVAGPRRGRGRAGAISSSTTAESRSSSERRAAGSAPRSAARRSGRPACQPGGQDHDARRRPRAAEPSRSPSTSVAAPRRFSDPVSERLQHGHRDRRWRPGRPRRRRSSGRPRPSRGSLSRPIPAYSR